MTKLYVGNLPYSVNDQSLGEVFAAYGTVVSSSVIIDKATGRSKGFGFVELEDDTMAQNAINDLNGKDMQGRNLVVSVARPMEPRPQRSGGFDRNRGSRY